MLATLSGLNRLKATTLAICMVNATCYRSVDNPAVGSTMEAAGEILSRDTSLELPEDIRLVIWDLDGTFWHGTLSEGGIKLIEKHGLLVRRLNACGVMNSICSKNDIRPVQEVLAEHDLWDQFIFPDISWNPKGPRLRRLIERTQLRPASTLFIDDNPTNRAEALSYNPGLNVANEHFIDQLHHHSRLLGKLDPGLTRLRRYKLLEHRSTALGKAGAPPTDFLEKSRVEVTFCYDVRPHLTRVVELINRTNQLNFTKLRLPESQEAAEACLEPYLDHYVYH